MAQAEIATKGSTIDTVRAIRFNDEAALRQLYATNYPRVERFVLNNSGNQDQAKDVFQEAFIAVWRNIQMDKFQPQNESSLDAYIFQIAKNKWMDQLRSSHFTRVVSMEKAVVPQQEDDLPVEGEHAYLEAVKTHFKSLGENCRKVLRSFYFDNQSMKDIADAMGWTEATAKNNKYRCIQKLKELINKNS